jgi:hypothetical protein
MMSFAGQEVDAAAVFHLDVGILKLPNARVRDFAQRRFGVQCPLPDGQDRRSAGD